MHRPQEQQLAGHGTTPPTARAQRAHGRPWLMERGRYQAFYVGVRDRARYRN